MILIVFCIRQCFELAGWVKGSGISRVRSLLNSRGAGLEQEGVTGVEVVLRCWFKEASKLADCPFVRVSLCGRSVRLGHQFGLKEILQTGRRIREMESCVDRFYTRNTCYYAIWYNISGKLYNSD